MEKYYERQKQLQKEVNKLLEQHLLEHGEESF